MDVANGRRRTLNLGHFTRAYSTRLPPSSIQARLPCRAARTAARALGRSDSSRPRLMNWSSDRKNFINGLFKRLHPAGSHPGLSNQADSTFRRHVVLLTAALL